MPRDFRVYLDDILEAVVKINNYTSGVTKQDFSSDPKTLDAVIRNLEVIGEATKNVPEEIRLKHPEIEWRKIAGRRDILIREYYGI